EYDAAGGARRSIYKPPLQIANPAWSPDGRVVGFIDGLMSDEPAVGGDIFTVADTGGEPRNLTPGMKGSASWLTWTTESKILFGEYVEGDAAIAMVEPGIGRIELLFRGSEQLTAGAWGTNISVSRDGKIAAVVRTSFSAPPEVWAGAIGDWKKMTSRNAGLQAAWGEARSIRWK